MRARLLLAPRAGATPSRVSFPVPARGPAPSLAPALALVLALASAVPAEGQLLRRLGARARDAAERQLSVEVEQLVQRAVHCVFDDLDCVQRSRTEGQEVVLTDREGNVLIDDDGRPYQDPATVPADAAAEMGAAAPGAASQEAPREATQASGNFDFEAGTRVVFFDDYGGDVLGDFPRGLTLVRGNWDVVEVAGRRFLRNTGPRGATFKIELPEVLPDAFTMELDVHFPHGNQFLVAYTSPPAAGNWSSVEGNIFKVGAAQSSGLAVGRRGSGVESLVQTPAVNEGIATFRVMADGAHVKVYLNEERVANVPNAVMARTREIFFENPNFADDTNAMLIGPIRIAAGGRDLYDALEAEGRVAVEDILFDTGRTDIRPESADVLALIGAMLSEHPDLRLMIEGHTDVEGDFDANMELSAGRAAAVMRYLVETFGIDADRLRTIGLGPTHPVGSNATPEGRQRNRRVELVRIQAVG